MEAADNEPVPLGVGQSQREALVPAGVLERVVPDEPDPLDRTPVRRLEHRGASRELVELARDGVDPVEVRLEDGVEAPAVRSPRQRVESTSEAARLPSEEEDEDKEQENRASEPDDRGADDRSDGGVEVDRCVLRSKRSGHAERTTRPGDRGRV
jgi:hypothetical protein